MVPSALAATGTSPASAAASQLTRYPYLTDVVGAGSTDNATVNFDWTNGVVSGTVQSLACN